MSLTLVQGQEIHVINGQGKIEGGFIVVEPKINKSGCYVLQRGGHTYDVHPKRIVLNEEALSTIKATVSANSTVVNKELVKETNMSENVTAEAKAPVLFNKSEFAGYGELYAKEGPAGKMQVVSYSLLLPAINKYLSFNVYDGGFGKSGKVPPVADILAGKVESYPGLYPLKDIEKQRGKLTAGNYKKVE